MASENIKDHKFLDLLDLSDSEVEEWIPDTDEEWAVTDEEDDPEPNHQERSPQQCDLKLSSPPSGQGTRHRARSHDRMVPADLRADSLIIIL
ncbi:hypothetical protein PoB_004155500 [Plakobranchus ocellatus]|uniref:Uncharacterized protein n=1 Tax=Plakobranchus ocellatus TaxID=259542 RepID=A0AAV4B609_9GAST|nr:hypothetical protein PoB_004155500 [Plakobranchus ocellatus]